MVERELTLDDAVAYVVHVTSYYAWSLIRYEGLKRGERQHIHFVGRAPASDEHVAGVRKGEVCIFVDAHQAMSCGLVFSITPSQVIVCAGDDHGIIPPCFIVKAIDRRSGSQIFPVADVTELKVPDGKQRVSVRALQNHDDEFA